MATLAARSKQLPSAAELLGAAMTLRAGEPLTHVEERMHAETLGLLGDLDGWEAVYDDGRDLGLEAAVALGLKTAAAGRAAAPGGSAPAAGRDKTLPGLVAGAGAGVDQVRP